MQLGKILVERVPRVLVFQNDQKIVLPTGISLSELLHADDPVQATFDALSFGENWTGEFEPWLSPVEKQEIWASGVTYERSKIAREEESEGAAYFYDLVYQAERPELFFKATPERVSPPGGAIRVRRDSHWNVPEPELTLVISPKLQIVGYTIGNDVSSRDIEGENPLYLPQAKIYTGSCALGPTIRLATPDFNILEAEIRCVIARNKQPAFTGTTSVSRICRPLTSLVEWLGRENQFPDGVMLMTGTGIVPPDDFSMTLGDQVEISITGLGTLRNHVQ